MICQARFFLLLCTFLVASSLCAQRNHRLTAFHGTIHEMPMYSETKGFKAGIENFDSIGHIVLPELNFLPEFPDKNFPDYKLIDRFAFTLRAALTVEKEACYRITLASDDGSMLWIDETLSIDNDGMHPWRIMRDTLLLSAGKHELELWYYNAIGPCGLAFRADVTDSTYCAAAPVPEPFSCIAFDENEYRLNEEGREQIKAFLAERKTDTNQKISVTGYADPTGSDADNDALSLRRAKSVGAYLLEFSALAEGDIELVGEGETETLTAEETRCPTNRAVVVRVVRR